ncbi:hypothetical protein RFI_34162 [Reticulomyxa filosa]|uniref:Uncharacterized protein n=1 Tax=Reticulomyxa filosa TaxID=46433 RepID=X6LR71_RETFI|nr:hypothetical protein RFI_34162 [Reticulomyxa filosa]|eukprot:ETO03250.1 hypothetical protein RFI_34162 [Reticulomyxa filosa]
MRSFTLWSTCAVFREKNCQVKPVPEYSVFKRLLKLQYKSEISDISVCMYSIFQCIAHYNMDRIRFVWLRIWKILAEHFCFAGTHSNFHISLSAIDSLRQLADKFLEKDELSNFNFQKDFLKPFQVIILGTSSSDVRELVVQCMARLIKSRYRNIQSGWKCVFAVLGAAAHDRNEQLVISCYDTMVATLDLYFPMIERVSTHPLSHLTEDEVTTTTDMKMVGTSLNEEDVPPSVSISTNVALGDSRSGGVVSAESVRRLKLLRIDALSDCVDILIAFVQNRFTDLSTSAIDYLSKTAQYLFDSDHYLPLDPSLATNLQESEMQWTSSASNEGGHSMVQVSNSLTGGTPDMGRPLIKAWFLCLLGLSKAVNDHRLEVRTHALTVMFRLLRAQGGSFDGLMWTRIFQRLIFPVFAELRSSQGTLVVPASGEFAVDLKPLMKASSNVGNGRNNGNGDDDDDDESNLGQIRSTRLSTRHSEDAIHSGNHHSSTILTSFERSRRGSTGEEACKNQRTRSQSISEHPDDTLVTKVSMQSTIYEEYTWLETTCHPALSAMVELFNQFFNVTQVLLHDVLSLLTRFALFVCVCMIMLQRQYVEASQIGLQCLTRLIEANSIRFTTNHWSVIIAAVMQALHHALPHGLRSKASKRYPQSEQKDSSQENHKPKVIFFLLNVLDSHKTPPPDALLMGSKELVVLSESVLKLLQLLRQTFQSSLLLLTIHQCVEILNGVEQVQEFAMTLTRDAELMDHLTAFSGIFLLFEISTTEPPEHAIPVLLYRIEADAALCRLSMLCQCKSNGKRGSTVIKARDIKQLAEYRLIPLGIQLIQLLHIRERKQARSQSDIQYLLPVVVAFLQLLLNKESFPDNEFQSKLNTLFPYLVKVIECQNQQVRTFTFFFFFYGIPKKIMTIVEWNSKQNKD